MTNNAVASGGAQRELKPHITWDAFAAICILVSCILIPFEIAFKHLPLLGTSLVVYLLDLFFIIDMARHFRTGFRKGGVWIHDSHAIAREYRTRLFPADLVGCLPIDLIFLALPDLGFWGSSLVLWVRLLRMARIARLFHLFRRWEALNWTNPGYLRIAKLTSIATVIIHCVACAWFLTSRATGFPADCWAIRSGIEGASGLGQYLRSLYWTVTTMTTIGYGDITPARNIEYVFTIPVMLLGASMYAFIIGNVASLFSNLDSARSKFVRKLESTVRFLQNRNVPEAVIEKVQSYYEYLWDHHRGAQRSDQFDDLPAPLRLNVVSHLTRELVENVPLFKHCSPVVRHTLLDALCMHALTPGDEVIREGEVGKEIYFISSGELEVWSDGGKARQGTLGAGEYFGHLSLVLDEIRTASVRAATFCEMFVLPKEAFERIKKEYPEFQEALIKASKDTTRKMSEFVLKGIVL